MIWILVGIVGIQLVWLGLLTWILLRKRPEVFPLEEILPETGNETRRLRFQKRIDTVIDNIGR